MKRVLLIVETSRSYGRGIMAGISRFALEHGGWSIHFDDRGLLESPSDWLRHWKGDGIITRTAIPELRRILVNKRCPMVELHGNGRTHFSEVRICDQTIGVMAADYFMDRGFVHFGFYSCGNPWWSAQRLFPYEERLRQRGFQCHVYSDNFDKSEILHPIWENRFEKPLKRWLAGLPHPIAIWVITDHQALRVLEGCQSLGLRVPEDVAILGTSNDTLICNLLSPPLSSIDVNSMTIGYEAARRLEMKMNGTVPDFPYINVPPLTVVTRQSTDIIAVPDPDVADALHLIREHACLGITVAKVVAELGISRRSLERAFTKHFKRTPHAEIVRVQINNAKLLLQATSLSISAIARKSGFTNREYFITTFHREVGTTPHRYRNSVVNPSEFFPSNEQHEMAPPPTGE